MKELKIIDEYEKLTNDDNRYDFILNINNYEDANSLLQYLYQQAVNDDTLYKSDGIFVDYWTGKPSEEHNQNYYRVQQKIQNLEWEEEKKQSILENELTDRYADYNQWLWARGLMSSEGYPIFEGIEWWNNLPYKDRVESGHKWEGKILLKIHGFSYHPPDIREYRYDYMEYLDNLSDILNENSVLITSL